MASVILTQTDVIECLVVIFHILLSSLRLCKQPFLELLLDHVLLFPCKHCLILIDFVMIFAITVINPVPDCYSFKVQRILKNRISIHAACTIGLSSCH